MTDDELNAAVARIEGWEFWNDERWRLTDDAKRPLNGPPPYATDWQWCGPLVVKHRATVIVCDAVCFAKTKHGPYSEASTPQRAICLAVIAAHEDKA